MAVGRKKLLSLLYEGRILYSPTRSRTQYPASQAQRSFFCSWLEHDVADERPSLQPPPFYDRGFSSPPVDPHGYVQYAVTASAMLTRSSPGNPLPSSLLPFAASSLYCPNLDVLSLCQLLYINDVKTVKHSSSSESTYENPRESTFEGSYNHLHQRALDKEEESLQYQSPWSSDEVINWPNAISFGRLLSGPFLAWLIVEGLLQPAVVGLIVAGASDWLDGYVARRRVIDCVFGTYLDPLADKVLIGCVALSMAHAGYLPPALVALVITRDAALIGGSFILRAHSMNWQVSSLQEFSNVMKGGAQKVRPLYISKVNTVFQLALVGVALVQPAFGVEDTYSLVPLLSWCVAFTTCASSVGYGWKLFCRSR